VVFTKVLLGIRVLTMLSWRSGARGLQQVTETLKPESELSSSMLEKVYRLTLAQEIVEIEPKRNIASDPSSLCGPLILGRSHTARRRSGRDRAE